MAFSLLLTRATSWYLNPWEGYDINIPLCPQTLSEGLSPLHHISCFLRKGIMEPTLCVLLDCPSAWSCPRVFVWGFLWGKDFERRFGYLQGVVFTKNFWNFKAIPNKNHFDVCLKQTCFEKFKRFLWIGLHKCCFLWKCEVMFCWLKRV